MKGPLNQLHDIYLAHWVDFWGIQLGHVLKTYFVAFVREVG